MANRRFIDFPIASTVGDNDIVLIWQDGANKQTTKATILSGLPENLEDLNDVVISGLTNGQILRYDSVTGKWENTDQGNLDLNDLNDVSIVSPSNGQVLVYNSSTSKWENSSGGFVPYVGAVTTVDLGAQGLRAGYVRFDTSVASVPDEQGLMYWDASRSTAALIMNGTLQHIGQDTFFYVKNSSGSTIPKGTCVRFAGTDGASGHLLIVPFLANGSVPSSHFLGVTAEAITNGSFGQVMHFGELEGINTSGFTAGALLYASTTVAGGFQTTVPVAPNNIVLVAAAVNSKNNGAIVVRPTYGSNINIDEGVKITSPTTGDLLQLQAGGLWENKTKAQILGGTSSQFVKGDGSLDSTSYQPLLTNPVTGTGTTNYLPKFTGSTTIGNSIVQDAGIRIDIGGDIRLTPSSAVNIQAYTGSVYTNLFYNAASHNWQNSGGATKMFLNSNDNLLIGTTTDGGQKLQVTGTVALRASASGSSATQIPIFAADPSGTTRELVTRTPAQLLSDIGGQAALTNPVTGTGTTNYLPKFTGSTTIGNSQIFDNGTNVGIGTASPASLLHVSASYTAPTGGIDANVQLLTSNTSGASVINMLASNSSVSAIHFGDTDDANVGEIAYTHSNNNMLFVTNAGIRMRLDASGNLGLGVAPSAWGAGQRAFDFGSIGSIETDGDAVAMSNNRYFDGGANRYKINDFASIFVQINGQHIWYNAPSGTAGNAISFTQAMTLTSGGNLLVGTTSDNGARLQVSGTVTASSTTLTASANTYAGSSLKLTSFTGGTNIFLTSVSGLFALSNGGGADHLLIASTGAATFSSSVTANRYLINGSNGNSGQIIQQGDLFGSIATNLLLQSSSGNSIGFLTNGTNDIRMFINTIGNVGIGTTSPSGGRLQVNNGTNLNVAINTTTVDSVTTSRISSFNDAVSASLGLVINGTPLVFTTSDTERMRITSGGNVGIGTNTFTYSVSGRGYLGISGTTDSIIELQNNGSSAGYLFAPSTNVELVAVGTRFLNFTTNGTERMRITSGGNLLIGTTTDSGQRLQVSGTSKFNNNMDIGTSSTNNILMYCAGSNNPSVGVYGGAGSNSANGAASLNVVDFTNNKYWQIQIDGSSQLATFYYNGSVWSKVGYQTTGGTWTNSDKRRKENIEISKYGLNEVLQLKPKKFNYKLDERKIKNLGFIAQDVIDLIPESVQTDIDGQEEYYAMNYSNLVPVLVKAIQELKQEIDTLKN